MMKTLARIVRLAAVMSLLALVVVPSALAIRFTDDSFQVPKAAVAAELVAVVRADDAARHLIAVVGEAQRQRTRHDDEREQRQNQRDSREA